MSAPPDDTLPRLQRLLGGAALAPLRARLRRRLASLPASAAVPPFRIGHLAVEEHAALAALQGTAPAPAASVWLDVPAIDRQLRGAGLAASLRDALVRIDGPLVDAAGLRASAAARWEQATAEPAHPLLRDWLAQVPGQALLRRLARRDADRAALLLQRAAAVLRRLPARGLARARLAAETLGDAHALDDGQPAATLVLAALRAAHAEAVRPREIWAAAGVLVNELARPALCLNLPAPGTPAEAGEPCWFSLRRLLRTPPAWNVAGREVWVCENPNLLAIAADALGAGCRPMVCTEGMPAAAQRVLLQQLLARGATLRFHGDFDWAGLHIGNQLMAQLGARPWRYGAADYEAAAGLCSAAGAAALRGTPAAATWDAALAPAMQRHGVAIAEEALAATLLPDLRA